MSADVTICIPTIPPRSDFLRRAVKSVQDQDVPGVLVSVWTDSAREGAWEARNKAAAAADTKWIGFLDDDDMLQAHHVSHLLECAEEHGVDMMWGWFQIIGGSDPWPQYRGLQYDPAEPHVVPITYMIRRELFMETRGFQADVYGAWDLQDQPVIDDAYRLSGGKLFASERKTWVWHHHGQNTSGLPSRW